MKARLNPIRTCLVVTLSLALVFTLDVRPVQADALRGAVIGAGVGAIIGGKNGARNGAIVGAITGGVSRNNRKRKGRR